MARVSRRKQIAAAQGLPVDELPKAAALRIFRTALYVANAEQADVFIDCRTVSGRSAIVVCEAKPQTVPSNYRSSILGMDQAEGSVFSE